MKDQQLKAAIAQFLKNSNFTAQRELEKAIRNAIAAGKLKGDESFTAGVTISAEIIDLNVTVYSRINLG
jgi:hypothetical protein